MGDEENLYELYQGCPLHGEEFMRECSVCGSEYCAQCFPGAGLCQNCAADVEEEELEDEDPDFSDVEDLDTIIGEDEEADEVIRESDEEYGGGF